MTEQEITQARADLVQLDIEQLRCGVMLQLLNIEALTKERDEYKTLAQGWVAENAPGGWIDSLRKKCAEYVKAADDMAMQHKVEPVAWLVRWRPTKHEPRDINPWVALSIAEYRSNPSREERPLFTHPAPPPTQQVVLLNEMRYIASISTGQVQRTAKAALAIVAAMNAPVTKPDSRPEYKTDWSAA